MTIASKAPEVAQVVERFEAIKVLIAVAERVLMNEYERNIIISSALVCTNALQAEYKRLNSEGVAESANSGESNAQS